MLVDKSSSKARLNRPVETRDAATTEGLCRRDLFRSLAWPSLCAAGLVSTASEEAFAQVRGQPAAGERGLNPLTWLNRGPDSFETVYEASTGVVAARLCNFSVRAPDGNLCQARLAYPVTVFDRMPLVVFCPDAGCKGAMYDAFIGALAASGYFVMALDDPRASAGMTNEVATKAAAESEARTPSIAEARFLIDMAGEAAKVLGTRANRVDASRVGVSGHGEGAWMALNLAGWGASDTNVISSRDGRVLAAFVLAPTFPVANARIVNGALEGGALALMAGPAGALPPALPGSGLIKLGLPAQSTTFGGLIGNSSNTRRSGRRQGLETQPLAAAVAAASIFFDWGLKRQGDRKRTLLSLDGRMLTGLSRPLQLSRA